MARRTAARPRDAGRCAGRCASRSPRRVAPPRPSLATASERTADTGTPTRLPRAGNAAPLAFLVARQRRRGDGQVGERRAPPPREAQGQRAPHDWGHRARLLQSVRPPPRCARCGASARDSLSLTMWAGRGPVGAVRCGGGDGVRGARGAQLHHARNGARARAGPRAAEHPVAVAARGAGEHQDPGVQARTAPRRARRALPRARTALHHAQPDRLPPRQLWEAPAPPRARPHRQRLPRVPRVRAGALPRARSAANTRVRVCVRARAAPEPRARAVPQYLSNLEILSLQCNYIRRVPAVIAYCRKFASLP